ncbi:TonB-dependent receptor domain-containing protein [Asticcacaulis sp. AC460]|uniref:TonB-dependent receptor domain-containing protein n=1 Tax=Asticcacaulis sp. AC460 TaxID=1282360 RepID=UPI00041C4548|nr:TonB-dependent receptor [Asticcacaulis sp. AC460]
MLALTVAGLLPGAVQAQNAPAAAPAAAADDVVVVTGYRASLRSALSKKRNADVMLDAINADDIADFPDANLAESLQRIPGISIDRDNGEGRQISVRGLGGDFTRVRINNLEALSTAGANDAGSTPNRSRAFDFNTFASELFNSLTVRKTASAETDEGSLGATVDLQTGRPFDYKDGAFAVSVQNAYNSNGGTNSPRITGLFSKRWYDGKMGFLASVAYSEKVSENDQFRRGPGSSDYTYRGTTWAGNEIPGRAGFAAPAGTTFGSVITNPAVIAAQTGSDPTAYATLYPGCAAASTNTTAVQPGCNNSVVKFPALGSIEQQDLEQKRLGVTASFQIQLAPRTRLTIDGLYSKFDNKSTIYQVSSVGLNRNNTNAGFNTANAGTAVATKRGFYPGLCTAATETDLAPGQDCGQQMNGTTLVAGTQFSYNPFNLDPYDYFNSTASPGYIASTNGMAFRDALIGRPAVKVLDAHVTNNNADYLKLSNIDWRSAADRGQYSTEFNQVSFNLTHAFTDNFRADITVGASKSFNHYQGLLVEFNSMDRPEVFTYDERAGGDMPTFNPGFDLTDASKWGIIKGFSGMRNYIRDTENTYEGAKADFTWDINDTFSFKFGAVTRKYGFSTNQFERNSDLLNPTEKEAKVSVDSLSRVIDFGDGLEVSEGTPTAFRAPSIEAFSSVFGFDCNCVNKYGDFRITRKRNRTASFTVAEETQGVYGQLNFKHDILGRNLFGNIGVRQVSTEVLSQGETTAGRHIFGTNKYDDVLPSMNVAWEVMDDLYIRAGASKVMARPQLVNLSPAVSAISVPAAGGEAAGGTLTVGNPKLKPFRATAYDLAAEWYFAKNGLLSLSLFKKDIDSYPQTILYSAPLSTFLDAEAIDALKLQFTDPDQIAYVSDDRPFLARQVSDAPGGSLQGWEFSYQQDFNFLPGLLSHTGVQFNMTHIDSELTYILDPGTVNATTGVVTKAPTYGNGPWLNASPDAINLTFYYETEKLSARVSAAQRKGYYTTYPIASGACAVGLNADGTPCDGPLMNEFGGSEGTLNVDFAISYNPAPHWTVTLEGLNMTNQTTNRYAYDQPVVTQYGSTGRTITLGLRYKY